MTRKRAFDGVRNFRDFGGYTGAGGQKMATGRFFRSANYALASDADLDSLAALGISAVVDLRRPEERERMPSRRWPDFTATLIENHDDDEGAGPMSWNGFMAGWDLSTAAMTAYHLGYYERAPTLPRLHDLYGRYFRQLADSQGPIVVHCAAGKDRTGIICALTHTLAGVHRDDMIADFLLTNDAAVFDAHAPLWQAEIEKQRGRAPSMATMHVAMGVHESYLERAFQVIDQTYGGVDRYLGEVLGIDAETRAKLEQKLFA
ncbi:MAG: tyrosine-protein phosphatase [Micropepsaceae bacterium]